MTFKDPISKDKSEYDQTINKISMANSAVGIDAQLTHAIIIDYLQQLHKRLDRIESQLGIKTN